MVAAARSPIQDYRRLCTDRIGARLERAGAAHCGRIRRCHGRIRSKLAVLGGNQMVTKWSQIAKIYVQYTFTLLSFRSLIIHENESQITRLRHHHSTITGQSPIIRLRSSGMTFIGGYMTSQLYWWPYDKHIISESYMSYLPQTITSSIIRLRSSDITAISWWPYHSITDHNQQ